MTQYFRLKELSPKDATEEAACGDRAQELHELLVPNVLEPLERRRVAGTLRPGCCRAHEVAWWADSMRAAVRHLSGGERNVDEDITQVAQRVGVDAYFAAAREAVKISTTILLQTQPDAPRLELYLTTVERALRLSLLREPLSPSPGSTDEPLFLGHVRLVLLPHLRPQVSRCARVLDAWRDLERSGLLDQMRIEETRQFSKRLGNTMKEKRTAKEARVPLRSCELPSCGAREEHVAHFKKCAACGGVVYCSKAHQAEHWPAHKAACKAARKAASQAAGAGGASQEAS